MKVLILTSFGSWQKACSSLKTVASGYVLKDAQPEELVARGMGTREMAGNLFVSEKTVKTHVANILQKLRVKSRTQAAL